MLRLKMSRRGSRSFRGPVQRVFAGREVRQGPDDRCGTLLPEKVGIRFFHRHLLDLSADAGNPMTARIRRRDLIAGFQYFRSRRRSTLLPCSERVVPRRERKSRRMDFQSVLVGLEVQPTVRNLSAGTVLPHYFMGDFRTSVS